MAQLEIAYLTGDVERRELSKQQPVSIGNHSSNDVCIDEPGVDLIHCRVAWNKTAYEVVAAGTEPLDINGNLVQRALLTAGDVLRIGSVDITLVDEAGESLVDHGDVGLKPTSDELKSALADSKKKPESIKPPAKKAAPKPPPAPALEPEPEDAAAEILDGELFDDDDIDEIDDVDDVADGDWLEGLAEESRVATPQRRSLPERSDQRGQPASKQGGEPAGEGEASEEEAADSMTDRLRSAMRHQQHRPGDEDTIRSPLILTLLGGSAILILAAVTFYFLAWRQTTADEFKAAQQLYNEQKFAPAIKALDQFVAFHPRDPLADDAEVLADLARIDQQIVGGAPKWELGLSALSEFISRHRDDDDFSREDVFNRAGDIALGAARDAGKPPFNRDMLQISFDAMTPFTTYKPDAGEATQRTLELENAQKAADAAITRHETFEAGVAKLDGELENKDPMAALVTRRDLLARYPEFQNDKTIAEKLTATLSTEQGLVTVEQVDQPGIAEDREINLTDQLTLAFNSRTSTSENSVDQAVWVLAKDCCYGVDTVTGKARWRRVIGFDTPFFPIRESSVRNLLVYDTNHEELARIQLDTGALLWRQTIGERVSGEPLIDGGQIYVPTEGGHLYKVDLQTGNISTKVTFSQEISAPVLLPGGSHLIVAGNREVLYTLTKSPLECVKVTHFEHPPDSIQAPLLYLNPYVLLIENGSGNGRLRLINAADPLKLTQIATGRVNGLVVDKPVIRGRDLFIPSIPERVTAFSVSDDTGELPLDDGPAFQVEGQTFQADESRPTPIFLMTGPDRKVWMASSALRLLQLQTDAIEAEQTVAAVGLASQPEQRIDDVLYSARRRQFADAVTLTPFSREDSASTSDGEGLGSSSWQAVLGARVLAWSVSRPPNETLLCITEGGHIFRISERTWGEGRFATEATILLTADQADELEQPLFATALPDGKLAAAAGENVKRAWRLSSTGLREGNYTLDEPLQLAPVAFGSRLIFPVQGALHTPDVLPFKLPTDEAENTTWRQVLAVDDTNAIAITEGGAILKIRLETSSPRSLVQDNRIELGTPADVRGDVGDGVLLLADANRRALHLDPATLDVRAEHTFDDAISNDVWLDSNSAFVETGGTQLHRLDVAAGLESAWTQPHDLGGVSLAGPPLIVGDRVVVSLLDGRVRVLGLEDGALVTEANVGAALSDGPFSIGDGIYTWTLDGTLVRLTQLLSE